MHSRFVAYNGYAKKFMLVLNEPDEQKRVSLLYGENNKLNKGLRRLQNYQEKIRSEKEADILMSGVTAGASAAGSDNKVQ